MDYGKNSLSQSLWRFVTFFNGSRKSKSKERRFAETRFFFSPLKLKMLILINSYTAMASEVTIMYNHENLILLQLQFTTNYIL